MITEAFSGNVDQEAKVKKAIDHRFSGNIGEGALIDDFLCDFFHRVESRIEDHGVMASEATSLVIQNQRFLAEHLCICVPYIHFRHEQVPAEMICLPLASLFGSGSSANDGRRIIIRSLAEA